MDSLGFLQEDAYYKVLKAFAAGAYDLKKELMLAKLRNELSITDQKHATLRKMIEEGKELDQRAFEAAGAHDRAYDQPVHRHNERHHAAPDRYGGADGSGYARPASTLQPPDSPFGQTAQAGSKRPATQTNGMRPSRPPKRQKKEGSVGPPDQPGHLPNFPPGVGADINELIGYKVQRWWPENGGWFEGAITDYRPSTGEHCIVYDMNTPHETYEWFNMSFAGAKEYRLLNERINIIEHAPQGAQMQHAPAQRQATIDNRVPPKKPGGSGRGRGLAGGRGRGRGERIMASHVNGRQQGGYSHPQTDQTVYRPASSSRLNGTGARAAFIVESDDDSSSDNSFSE